MVPVSLGLASVLYTFYPPMIGNPVLLHRRRSGRGRLLDLGRADVGQLAAWKRDNPGAPVPLAMFANVAGSYLWAWTAVGAALELLFQILPVALGLKSTIDAGLARVFFSWTLHAIVYFWLMPTYIAYYTIFPRAIGGPLYSDAMARICLHPVRRRGDADRRPPSVRRSAGRRRLQVHAFGLHGARRAADAADGVHDLRVGRDRRPPARGHGCVRLARRAAVAQSDHARDRASRS